MVATLAPGPCAGIPSSLDPVDWHDAIGRYAPVLQVLPAAKWVEHGHATEVHGHGVSGTQGRNRKVVGANPEGGWILHYALGKTKKWSPFLLAPLLNTIQKEEPSALLRN